ncbi:SDR family NAD(P)-dependent oxidoreductase [Williamsia sp. M5A3_1d]
MKSVDGRVAVVTGASMGIGAATAHALADAGAHVAIVARGAEKLKQTATEIGPRAHPFACDLTDPDAIADMVDRVTTSLGAPEVLINNVGAGTFKPLSDMDYREVWHAVNLPYAAAVAATRCVVPSMEARGEGHIVNITSPAGYFPLPYMAPYTASRHAMVGLSLSLRDELARSGVGVSLVCPAEVNTGYFERNDADMAWYPKMSRFFPTLEPEDVARHVLAAIRTNRREDIFPIRLRLMIAAHRRAPVASLAIVKRLGLYDPQRSV